MGNENYVEAKLWDPDVDPVYTGKKSKAGIIMAIAAVVVVGVVTTLVLFRFMDSPVEPPYNGDSPGYQNGPTGHYIPGGNDQGFTSPHEFPTQEPPGQFEPPTMPQMGSPVENDLAQGIALYQGGQYDAAIAVFNRVLQTDRDSVSAFTHRGLSLFQQGNFHAAISDFTNAHRRAPQNAELLAWRGASYFRVGFHVEALADLSRAIEMDPNNIGAREYRARTHEAMGNHAEAVADNNVANVLRQQQQGAPQEEA